MMKKLLFTAILGLLAFNAFTQEIESAPLLSVSFNPGLGNGKVHSAKLQHQHGLFNGGNLLLNLHLGSRFSVASGFGILTFNANPIIDGIQVATEIDFLQLPLRVEYIGGKGAVRFKIGFIGIYNVHLTSVTDLGNDETVTENNLGGNFGQSVDIGPVFQVSKKLSTSICLEHQFTISEAKGTKIDVENYLVKFGLQYSIITTKK